MSASFLAELNVSLQDSHAFARLSGDYNPLHLDPVAARRTKFGGTVTHGIHLLLRALDRLVPNETVGGHLPGALTVTFDNPVATGTPVTVEAHRVGTTFRIRGHAAGKQAFNATVELQPRPARGLEIPDTEFPACVPQELDFPAAAASGSLELRLRRSLLQELFPALARLPNPTWLADLLASTRIVGMWCPGLHSVYSGLKLTRAAADASDATMSYRVGATEPRFQLLRIQINGAYFSGTVDALFRPRPVAQPSLAKVATLVGANEFAGHRVLVIGGSRGLGELAAKIAAAGGADVTITYASGAQDAARIRDELAASGKSCDIRRLDLAQTDQHPTDWLTSRAFTHVYYFASPQIAKNTGAWDEMLFRRFTAIYLNGIASVVDRLAAIRNPRSSELRFLFPSSIFVTQPEPGFAEYVAAKAASEALCDQLQLRRAVHFLKPRLPRMRTDQTSGLDASLVQDPIRVMIDVIRSTHAREQQVWSAIT